MLCINIACTAGVLQDSDDEESAHSNTIIPSCSGRQSKAMLAVQWTFVTIIVLFAVQIWKKWYHQSFQNIEHVLLNPSDWKSADAPNVMAPLKQFELAPITASTRSPLFHFIHFMSQSEKIESNSAVPPQHWSFRHQRSLESILFHHPNAAVIVHSDDLTGASFASLTDAGFNVSVRPIQLAALAAAAAIESAPLLQPWLNGDYWSAPAHGPGFADLYRLLLLHAHGGVYLDTDAVAARPLDALRNVFALDSRPGSPDQGALMAFPDPRSPFLLDCLGEFGAPQPPASGLLARVFLQRWQHAPHDVAALPTDLVYPLAAPEVARACAGAPPAADGAGAALRLRERLAAAAPYAVHLPLRGRAAVRPGSVCEHLLSRYCVLCGAADGPAGPAGPAWHPPRPLGSWNGTALRLSGPGRPWRSRG
jgi:hypothetical protein